MRDTTLGDERSVMITGSSTDDRPDPFWAIRTTHEVAKANVDVAFMKSEGVDVFDWCGSAPPPLPACPFRAAPTQTLATKAAAASKAAGAAKKSATAVVTAVVDANGPSGSECVVSGIPIIYNTHDVAPGVELRIFQKRSTAGAVKKPKAINSRDLISKSMSGHKRNSSQSDNHKQKKLKA